MARPWNHPTSDTVAEADRLQREHGVPRPAALSLARRGLIGDGALDRFLNPRLKGLADPGPLNQLERAVTRTWDAIDAGEQIFLHGDYDVDGITGTAFLARTLRSLGGVVHAFVPSRSDGYGIGAASLAAIRSAAARLVITVDCGTSAVEEIADLAASDIDVIVLDHHHAAAELPAALALVNPRLNQAQEQFGNLAAVGVAAKFMHAMAAARPGKLDPEVYKEALQLVALGTIADVVPLVEENRILVSFGLRRLAESKLAGVQALKAVARIDRRQITATDVAFSLAPRLNAVGRMGDAKDALALLLADDPAEAYRLAEHIEDCNLRRREADRAVLDGALTQVNGRDPLPAALVVWSEDWPVGVVGIAASRLVDRYRRPSFVIAVEGDTARGSARSRAGLPLPDLLTACDDLLLQHGGHAQAAGFSMNTASLPAFRDRIEALCAAGQGEPDEASWDLDATVNLAELTAECVDWIERLAPFGQGNPEPLFGGRGLELAESPSVVGKTHLRVVFRDGSRRLKGIAFRQGNRAEELARARKVNAVFHASFDTWRGNRDIQLVVRELGTEEP